MGASDCSYSKIGDTGIFVTIRLRAVPLQSVESKLGRTGESELASAFARVSPAELRLD